MLSLTYPVIAWGAADVLTAPGGYTLLGSTTSVVGATDPYNGTTAYTCTDNDAGAESAVYKSFTCLTTQALVTFLIRAGSAAASTLRLYDNTSGVDRYRVNITWSGGVPTISSTTNGTTLYGPIALGLSWYLIVGEGTAGSLGHTCFYLINPAGATASNTGSMLWYVRNFVLLDLYDHPHFFTRPRQGYEAASAPSGTRDAWTFGNEYVLRATARWIPDRPRATPVAVSGMDGLNETAGVDCGVRAMMKAGWNMEALIHSGDRTLIANPVASAYMTQPGPDWDIELEGSGESTVPFEFVSATAPFYGEGGGV